MTTRATIVGPAEAGPYDLPSLTYGYHDLEPVIDAETMTLHYEKHHRAYVDGVNAALAKHPQWLGLSIAQVLSRLDELPADIRTSVRNMGGGHFNHTFFWSVLSPGGRGEPSGDLRQAIVRDFGSVDQFRAQFEAAGAKHFGSGWVWLVADPREARKLEIVTLPNQDTVVATGKAGALACDLWEHAYYLKYRNRRADWLKAWWDVVNWESAAQRFSAIGERDDVPAVSPDDR